jgi:hypothetical protein
MLRKNTKQKVGKITVLDRFFERVRNSVAICQQTGETK